MDVWLALKIQALMIGVFSFFSYKISSFIFLNTVTEEEKESLEKDLFKPVRKHVMVFYVNAIMMKVLFLSMVATFLATIIKDLL